MKIIFSRLFLSVTLLLSINFSTLARMDGDVKTTVLKVETEFGPLNFEIHLPLKEANYLNRLVHVLKNDAAILAGYFKYAPADAIHFTLEQGTQEANGSATVFPINHIVLRKFPPLDSEHLSSSPDSLKELVLHELIHIIHMDQSRGVVKGLRSVFGSFAKLGGIAPRWFIEGIATWGESAMTNGGRLKNDLMRAEWEKAFSSSNFCQTIDCLDQPGEFPYGQYAYWTGAFFMEYLEGVKENSVQCLVFANSNNLPFFLNSAFSECFGKSAIAMYKEFREFTLDKIKSRTEENEEVLTPISDVLGSKSFQQGMALIGEKLVSVELDDRIQRVVEQNLETGESSEVSFSGKLSGIERWDERSISIKTFSNIRTSTKRKRAIYDFKNLGKKESKGDYNFNVQGEEVSFKFNGKNWNINQGEFSFPEEVSLYGLHSLNDGIYFKLFDARRDLSYLAFYDTKEKSVLAGPKVSPGFTILDSCSNGIVTREGGEVHYVNKTSRRSIKDSLMKRVLFASFGEKRSAVVLKDSKSTLYNWSKGCQHLLSSLNKNERITFKKVDLQKVDSKKESINETRSYPRARHFIPNYWMFNYAQATDELSYWSAMTSISDPDGRHNLSLMGIFYSGISEITPDITYTYEFPKDFYLSLSHSKRYSTSSQRVAYDSSEVSMVSFSKFFELGNFDFITSLYGSVIGVDDFISVRKEKEHGAVIRLKHVRTRLDDFLSKLLLKTRFFKREVEGNKDFNGTQSIAELEVNPFRNLFLTTDLSYGSLDKQDFTNGVLYGGGSYTEYHQFYGIPYNDIFGNEIKTLRASFNYQFLDIFRGPGLLPVFISELHLMGGTDLVSADRIYLGNRYLRNSSAQSYWAGVRTDLTIGYAIPISVDIIRTRVMNRYGRDIDSTISVIRGSLGF